MTRLGPRRSDGGPAFPPSALETQAANARTSEFEHDSQGSFVSVDKNEAGHPGVPVAIILYETGGPTSYKYLSGSGWGSGSRAPGLDPFSRRVEPGDRS